MLHPVEIAGQMALLDAASNGRAFLGLARGSWLGDSGIDQRNAPEAVAEAATIVAALLKGDRSGVSGQRFVLPAGAALRQRPFRESLPLLIGTWGTRLAHIAGEMADEVKIGGSANPKMVPLMRQWVDAGEAAGGRPPHAVGIVVGAVTVVDEDGRLARARARREVIMYIDVVGALDPTFEIPPGMLDQIRAERRVFGPGGGGQARPRRGPRPFRFCRHAGCGGRTRAGRPERRSRPDRFRHSTRDHRRPRSRTARRPGPAGHQGGDTPVTLGGGRNYEVAGRAEGGRRPGGGRGVRQRGRGRTGHLAARNAAAPTGHSRYARASRGTRARKMMPLLRSERRPGAA